MSKRAHIVLTEELIDQVDRLAGKRRRSVFVESAIRDKLRRDELTQVLEEDAGILKFEDYPEWKDADGVSAWVRSLRRGDNARLERITSTRPG